MDITKCMISISNKLNYQYTFDDRPVPIHHVFSNAGLLPALSKRADQLCILCLGYGLGLRFEEIENSMLGTKVIFDETTPDALRLLYLTDVLIDIANSSKKQNAANPNVVVLDELMYD